MKYNTTNLRANKEVGKPIKPIILLRFNYEKKNSCLKWRWD